MDEKQAKRLGELLKQKRTALGYSTHELARAAGVSHSTVVRFEQGQFSAPRPDKLARFAQHLELSLADLYAPAGYVVPDDLPSFDAYLYARYPQLPGRAITELTTHFKQLAAQYAISLDSAEPPTKEPTDETNRRRAA